MSGADKPERFWLRLPAGVTLRPISLAMDGGLPDPSPAGDWRLL